MEQTGVRLAGRDRLPYLDILRAGATYLVVLLHCIMPYIASPALFGHKSWWLCNVLSAVVRMGVPLFFMLSGYLLLSDPRSLQIKAFYKKRLSKLLLPFLAWDTAYYLFSSVVGGRPLSLLAFLQELLNQGSYYHLWFLYQLAGIYLLTPFLKRIVDGCTPKQLFLLVAVILTPVTFFRLFNLAAQPYLQIQIWDVLVEGYVGYFLLGYLLGSVSWGPRARRWIYLGGAAGLVLGVVGNYLCSSPEDMVLYFNAGYAINHYLTSAAAFVLVKYLPRTFQQKLGRLAAPVSRMSLGIYFIHPMVLAAAGWLVETASPALNVLVWFLLCAVGATVAVWVIERIPWLNKILL